MLNRIQPAGPVQAYKTYQVISPVSTHYRDGTCAEAGCLDHRNGWRTTVDEATDLGARQAQYIRKQSGRRYTEARTEVGLTAFTFEAGQRCFRTHKVPLGRPELYVVRDGDWRRYGSARRFSGPDAFVNDFGDHQDRIARIVNG